MHPVLLRIGRPDRGETMLFTGKIWCDSTIRQHRNSMHYLCLVGLITFLCLGLNSCSQTPDSVLNQTSGQRSVINCDDGTFWGPAYQNCLNRQVTLNNSDAIAAEADSTRLELASLVPKLTGLVYSISSKKHKTCLTEIQGKWLWTPCTRYGIGQQFHIGDRQKIKYWLATSPDKGGEPITLDGYAFRLETKKSIDRWLRLERCSEGQSSENDDCIEAIDDNDYETKKAAFQECLSVETNGENEGEVITTPCSNATFFIAIPNKYGTNQALDQGSRDSLKFNQTDRRFISIIAVTDRETNKRLDSIDGTLTSSRKTAQGEDCGQLSELALDAGLSEQEFEELYPDCKAKKPPAFVDISDAFRQQSDCQWFRHLTSGNAGESLKAICPDSRKSLAQQQEKTESSHLIIDACSLGLFSQDAECSRKEGIKKLYDHFEELDNGVIVQLTPADKPMQCARLGEQGKRISFVDCGKSENDDIRTQFRSKNLAIQAEAGEAGAQAEATGKIMIKLQSVANPELCIDAEKLIAIRCDDIDAYRGEGTFELTPSNSGVVSTNRLLPYNLHHCSIVSSQTENNAYDCRYNIPQKLKRWAELGFGLSFLGFVGLPFLVVNAPAVTIALSSLVASIPSFVFDGMVCASGEPNISLGSCISLGIGLGLELTLNFIGVSISKTIKKIASSAFTGMDLKEAFSTIRYYSAFDNVVAVGEVSGINNAVRRSFSYFAKKLFRSGSYAPESGQRLIGSSFINAVKKNKFSYQQTKELFAKLWNSGKGACGRLSCRHPLSPIPKPSEVDRFIQVEMVERTLPKMDNLTQLEKKNIRILLSPDATKSDIDLARQGI